MVDTRQLEFQCFAAAAKQIFLHLSCPRQEISPGVGVAMYLASTGLIGCQNILGVYINDFFRHPHVDAKSQVARQTRTITLVSKKCLEGSPEPKVAGSNPAERAIPFLYGNKESAAEAAFPAGCMEVADFIYRIVYAPRSLHSDTSSRSQLFSCEAPRFIEELGGRR
jgi:hypothetical protein